MNKKRQKEILAIVGEAKRLVDVITDTMPAGTKTYQLVHACIMIAGSAAGSIRIENRKEVVRMLQTELEDIATVYAELHNETRLEEN